MKMFSSLTDTASLHYHNHAHHITTRRKTTVIKCDIVTWREVDCTDLRVIKLQGSFCFWGAQEVHLSRWLFSSTGSQQAKEKKRLDRRSRIAAFDHAGKKIKNIAKKKQ